VEQLKRLSTLVDSRRTALHQVRVVERSARVERSADKL